MGFTENKVGVNYRHLLFLRFLEKKWPIADQRRFESSLISNPFSGISAVALKPGCHLGARGPAAEPGPHEWRIIPGLTVLTTASEVSPWSQTCRRLASLSHSAGVQVVPGVGSAQGPAPGRQGALLPVRLCKAALWSECTSLVALFTSIKSSYKVSREKINQMNHSLHFFCKAQALRKSGHGS